MKSPSDQRTGKSNDSRSSYITPQQTGVLFIIRQQVQPPFRHAVMQSQHPWIISQQALSPLVQVTVQPDLVISHLHKPHIKLQEHTIIPFIMQQQLTMPPWSMVTRFCIMATAVGSSQTQVIFIPPATFSILKLHRGTIIQFGAIGIAGDGAAAPPDIIPGIIIPVRSIIIAVVMIPPLLKEARNESHFCRIRRQVQSNHKTD